MGLLVYKVADYSFTAEREQYRACLLYTSKESAHRSGCPGGRERFLFFVLIQTLFYICPF